MEDGVDGSACGEFACECVHVPADDAEEFGWGFFTGYFEGEVFAVGTHFLRGRLEAEVLHEEEGAGIFAAERAEFGEGSDGGLVEFIKGCVGIDGDFRGEIGEGDVFVCVMSEFLYKIVEVFWFE